MLEVGSLVDGKYKILSEIGHGGMSVVYMAINEKANKTWAIKEVRKDGVLDFEAVRQGLVVETDMLKKLKHSNLPSIIDVIDEKDSFLIVMDYIEGNSLAKALQEYGAQPQDLVIEWAKQLCDVLGYLHTRTPAIIYRDMKPANVMLKPDGNLTLIDFGTAREYKEKNLADTTCLGTIGYAAPEQFGGMGQTDARTDIYCLGATLYHLVTGANPSEPPYEIKPIREINPSLSSGLERIILKCTQRNPDDRYQSCAELMYALEHYEEIDDLYRKKQVRKLSTFITSIVMSGAFAVAGMFCNQTAAKMVTDSYDSIIDEANRAQTYDEKLSKYEEAIAVPDKGGDTTAYLQLIKLFKSDNVYTVDEYKKLEKLITNHRDELRENTADYVELSFEMGKLTWYYYGNDGAEKNNKTSRATNATTWFQNVVSLAGDDYPNMGMARAYMSIGDFYGTIPGLIIEGSDKGQYQPVFDQFSELMDTICADESEAEIVKLEIIELTRSLIQQYATKLKQDGITEQQMNDMYQTVNNYLNSVNTTTDTTEEMKNETLSLMEDTLKAIQMAYRTKEGN